MSISNTILQQYNSFRKLKQGRFKEAAEVLEKFQSIHSSSVKGHYFLGEAYRRSGDGAKVTLAYKNALEMFRQSPATNGGSNGSGLGRADSAF